LAAAAAAAPLLCVLSCAAQAARHALIAAQGQPHASGCHGCGVQTASHRRVAWLRCSPQGAAPATSTTHAHAAAQDGGSGHCRLCLASTKQLAVLEADIEGLVCQLDGYKRAVADYEQQARPWP
jgi:hypothetical protein